MSDPSLASFEYLEKLPGTTFNKLYEQPSTALAIFRRMLPHLAKTFVMTLLYMSKPLPLADLDEWVEPNSQRERGDALSTLSRLHIVAITAPSRDNPQHVSLLPNFRKSLRYALTGGGNHHSFGVPSQDSDPDVTIEALDEYATSQWEGILHYLVHSVGGGRASGKLSESVTTLLTSGDLVRRPGSGPGAHGITKSGFSFLLQEVNAQVWTLLLLFIENSELLGMNSVEVLSFLFMLGSLELGQAYTTTTLTESQLHTLNQLVDFGLVYIPESTPTLFFPTRLSTTLTSDATALRSVGAGFDAAIASRGGESQGFIIIETNYRMYAYTSSPLQIAVLALFTKLYIRYPNLVAGKITQKSIGEAIRHGITADQVIAYLNTHAHPQLHKTPAALAGGPVLPPTVVDQIKLWQLETERMETIPGFLFKDFQDFKEYNDCSKYADEIGVLQWKSDGKRTFFVTRHEQLRDFIKSRKAREAAK
ncbi:RNA polymerase II transcription factor-like protein B subunit 2 [Calycina marina]|uniref:RNA polymerase II transcription factor B subunit 2 n=1 Tax=Calycina marina TaxID=1763456 RepID=A0A9P7ZBQ8_9HELO|nr:RNA polymerase II transcription factor-like protein B subunit 2 [Calycina marina]